MPRLKVSKWLPILINVTLLIATLTTVHAQVSLEFDSGDCEEMSFTAGGVTVNCLACEGLV
jgi:hypothetical protein